MAKAIITTTLKETLGIYERTTLDIMGTASSKSNIYHGRSRTDLQEGAALIYIRRGVFSGRRPFIKTAMAGLFGSHLYRLNDAA